MDSLIGIFDTLDLTVAATPVKQSPVYTPKKGVLYFDLETAPDYDRQELFDLDPIPAEIIRTPQSGCPAIEEMLDKTIDEFKVLLKKLNPVDDVLDSLESQENKTKKPRKGLLTAIADFKKDPLTREQMIADQRKEMSVTPEMCRVIALGYALGGETVSLVFDGNPRGITEQHILETFWELARQCRQVCGFNILHFDLPVIFVRSMLLDISPTRQFDMTPWKSEVIDLMAKRYPKSKATGLKKLCKLMGIPVPAGDVEGSQVEQLLKDNPVKLGEYVRSDVDICIALHQMYTKFFC